MASRYFKYNFFVYATSTPGTYAVGNTGASPETVYANGSSTQIDDVSPDNTFTSEYNNAKYVGDFKASNGTNFIGIYQHEYGKPDSSYTGGLFLYTNSNYAKGQTITGFSPNTAEPICFASGTLIRTVAGDVAVERLAVGDLVVTASGAYRPVKWLGHRALDCRRHPRPREAMPVRIAAHAFGPYHPARDLVVSPGHSICLDLFGEVLVPAVRLVNGATIKQLDVDKVTYWHVELESHDIVLAENLPCESYIDCGTRAFFVESALVDLSALPDARVLTTDDYCRPFHPEGSLVDFARERLCRRATELGWRLDTSESLAGEDASATAPSKASCLRVG